MVFHISLILIPLLVALVLTELGIILKRVPVKRCSRLQLKGRSDAVYCAIVFGLLAAAQFIFFILTNLFIDRCMAVPVNGLPDSVVLLVSFLCSGSVFLRMYDQFGKLRRLTAQCAVLALVLVVAETLVFNGKSFCTNYQEKTYTADQMEITEGDMTELDENNSIKIQRSGAVDVHDLPDFAGAVRVNAIQPEDSRNLRIQLKMKDNNFSEEYIIVGDKQTSGRNYSCDFVIHPHEDLRSMRIQFLNVQTTVNLRSVTFCTTLPFYFSALRYFVLFAVLAAILAIRITGFAQVRYDHENRFHRIAVAVMMVACVSSTLFYHVREEVMVTYPFENAVKDYDPYSQTFDALQKGQVYLDVEPDAGLAELENVYDRGLRNNSGASSIWDRAYYDGKYYSYFGITPVLVLFYPVYWITGALPTMVTTNEFFAVFAVFFLCLTLHAAMRLFAPRGNLLLFLLMMPAATCACGALYCFQYPNMYGAAVAAALCFCFATLWLGFSACLAKRHSAKLILLAACGLALGLCAGSRPSMAVCGLVLAPLFLGILLDKQQSLRCRLEQAYVFLIPVLLAGAGLMYYNALRFGSPLDFGASYQLTVSNISANHLRLSALPAAFMHYFCHIPSFRNLFPYFGMNGAGVANYGMYVYIDIMFGAFFLPLLLMGTFLLPSSLRMQPQSDGIAKLRERGFLVGCFVIALFIAWADFCLAGVHLRYLFDLMPVMLPGCVCTILRTTTLRSKTQYGLAVLAAFLTMVVVWMLMLTDNGHTTAQKYPELFETVEDLVVFWR